MNTPASARRVPGNPRHVPGNPVRDLPLHDLAGFTHRWVDAGGVRLHAVEGGRPGGPAVVLLAGFPQTWWAWRKVMPALADRFHVIAIDLPGQGHSERPERGYDTHTVAAHVHAAVKALGVSTYWLVAHDIGAWVAFSLALTHREPAARSRAARRRHPGHHPPRLRSRPTRSGRGRPGTSPSTSCPTCPRHCSPAANGSTSAGS